MEDHIKKVRILIADDHTLIRQGARTLLESRKGWKIVGEAKNGSETVAKARKLKPRVVILDLSMPGMDGMKSICQICRESPNIGVIVLTMHDSPAMVQAALDAGASAYILKTDLRAYLVQAVKAVLRGERSLTPRVSEIILERFLKKDLTPPVQQPTRREIEIIQLLAAGRTSKEIASQLGVAVTTIQTHRANIMQKLGFHSLADLIRYALNHGGALAS